MHIVKFWRFQFLRGFYLVSQMTSGSSLFTATARATTTITLHEVSTGGGFLTGIQMTARSVSLGLCPGVRYGAVADL